nr:MAG TPA: hypothetical protein [Caudoviricetes sp.]
MHIMIFTRFLYVFILFCTGIYYLVLFSYCTHFAFRL